MNEQYKNSPIDFSGSEVNRKALTTTEAGVPGELLQSGEFSPKLKAVEGQFSAGQDTYNVGTGFFLGIEDEAVKFSIGNGTTDYITWDGANINIRTNLSETVFPQFISGTSERLSTDITDNTTMHVGLVETSHGIIVNRLTFRSGGAAVTPGTVKIGIYSEDGQEKIIEETSASISATFTYQTITLATPVYLAPGAYYVALVGVSTVSASFMGWKSPLDDDTYAVTSGKVTSGYMTVTASTLPTTFNPVSDITFAHNRALVVRLDNI